MNETIHRFSEVCITQTAAVLVGYRQFKIKASRLTDTVDGSEENPPTSDGDQTA